MGKRQFRIFREKVLDHVQELLMQRSVQVVLHNRVVLQGKLLSLGNGHIELLDGRMHRHTVPVQQITEIIYDKETAF